MAASGAELCSGSRQVQSFGPDENYERAGNGDVEEEVSYVTLDLGNVEPTLVPSSSTYHLIGLDTPNPFLQLSGTIFKGSYQNLLGTELLFSEEKDDHDHSKKSIAHLANTEQRIRFREVELRPKTSDPAADTVGPGRRKRAATKDNVSSSMMQDVNVMTGSARGASAEAPPPRGGAPRAREGKSIRGLEKGAEGNEGPSEGTPPRPQDSEAMDVTE
ncbi:hypothetical protein EW146_g6113 [Bondarzewia mesenterica]|uniref:Transcription factor TFIIIC triple barrel domain-containing protein n=1 Tax=Bondarzewia mesenterica TaxID=1095465 RepID=A0A4S4LPI6_9AGAM|nr:hypothetical protein EW146_g6113 [Bondarzewia mesenterica]